MMEEMQQSREQLTYSYSDITGFDRNGFTLSDGTRVDFKECAEQRGRSEVCVGDRDAIAEPPYFQFPAREKIIRVQFDRKGICSKSKNQKDFREMQQKINGMGYTTSDLS